MNKQSFVSKTKAATLLFIAAVLFSTSSFATDAPGKDATSSKTFNVKYLSNEEDCFLFNVKYDNVTSGSFDLIIKDETGEIIYQRSFSDKNFSKKFQLGKTLIKAIFIIRPQHAADQSFEEVIQSRLTEDVVVSRL